ncbi:MAG: DUF4347 domain-containing protein, partial [Alkalinema sp. RL_2_19]|nr:DUF4347 domain-containing protein [Alkalinema sp. RL_2_19]
MLNHSTLNPPSPFDLNPVTTVADPTSVLFVDAGVGQRGLLTGRAAADTAVYWLDGVNPAIDQITQVLANYHDLDSVQIVSHGQVGAIQLGQTWLTSDNFTHYGRQLQTWGKALNATGDLLLYGCDVGQGQVGLSLVVGLAQLTGADVAASNDLTGNAALGGDWDLEVRSGEINIPGLVAEQFQGVLNPIVSLPGLAVTYQENAEPVVLDPGATVSDLTSMDFDTGTLTVTVSAGGTIGDRLSLKAQGDSVGQIGLDGRIVKFGGMPIGTYTGGIGSEALVFTFNASATPAAVQVLVKNLTYSNVAEDITSGNRTLQMVLTDGDGGTSQTVQKTVIVTGVNDAP